MSGHETVHAAWVAAWAALTDVPKGSKADMGTYSVSYADLPTILAHVRPTLAEHGLAVHQDVTGTDTQIAVATTLTHSSGGQLTTGPISMAAGRGPQAAGSAISYARRYSLLAALGLGTADDDDGNTAQRTMPDPPSASQMKAMHAQMAGWERDAKLDFVSAVLDRRIASAKELSKQEVGRVLDALTDLEETP